MKIERIEMFHVSMPLRGLVVLPRGSSRSLVEGKRVILVKITAADGTVGWGEAGPSRRWSYETLESAESSIGGYFIPALLGHDAEDIAGAHARMDDEVAPGFDQGQPIAKAALDMALYDLLGKKSGKCVQEIVGSMEQDRIRLSWLVSVSNPDKAREEVAHAKSRGYTAFKVKVGHDPGMDEANVKAVMDGAGPKGFVWCDANQGYDPETALQKARAFEELGITIFEQPVASHHLSALRGLSEKTSLEIALDESVLSVPFMEELIRLGLVKSIVVKVNKAGGLFHARELARVARERGIGLLGSGLMDAPLGYAASAHLFAAYGFDRPIDLNGPQFIKDTYSANGFGEGGGEAIVSRTPGLGIEVDEEKVRQYRWDPARLHASAVGNAPR
ncbi:MAG: mandelate racemase/muconate lactonizing enzyme family protein [Candidatus Methylomirabilia bacterium]